MKRLLVVFSLVACIAGLFVPSASAQFETASVLGYVRDSSGAALGGSNVTLTNQETGITQTAKSKADGNYMFVSVAPGPYKVTTETTGFDKSETPTFQLTTNARQRIDVALKAGSVNETVTVSSAATLLETETSSRGEVIGTREIENLPLNGRSYADLALLAPGVRKSVLENQSNTSREASFNINGQRSAFNNFLLDGLDNNTYGTSNQGFANENIPPSPDAVDEFRIETDNYSAEYGRASGGVINATVRRGTNEFHGRAWDYIRNTSLNAVGPFSPSGGIKPVLIRNQFGGTFGGPILHDKAFFFADYEGLKEIDKSYTTATIPSASQRAGIFTTMNATGSLVPIPIRNPLTGAIYADGIIPQSSFSPLATAVFNALPSETNPSPNGVAAANNYVSLPRASIDDKKGDGRVDYTVNPKLILFGRYSQHNANLFVPGNIPGAAGGNNNGNVLIENRNIAMGVTYTVSSSSIFDARFGIGYNKGGKSPIGLGSPSLLTAAGITNGIPTDPSIVRPLNAQGLNGFSQLGDQGSNPQFQNPTVYNPKVNYTLLKGINSFKIGYEFQSISTQINDFNPSFGADTYNGKFTAVGKPVAGAIGNQAYGAADFIFGLRSNYQLNNFRVIGLQQRMNFMYLQDDIKVSPKLTVNAGIRYELASPQYVDGNHLANFDPTTDTLQQATNGSFYNRGLVHMKLNNVAPRFGLAYSVDAKTVIRSGFAINYTQFNREGGENLLAYNGPYIVNASIDQKPSMALCTTDTQDQTACFRPTQQGYATNLVTSAAFNPLKAQSRYIPRDNPTGYVESYFGSFQRDLGHNMLVDVSYVGNHGVHLMVLADYNQAAINAQTATCSATVKTGCLSLQARRPVANFNTIEIAFGGGVSNYNAIQAKLEKRYSQGLYFLDSFTYSRGFDNASGHLESSGGDNSRVNFANIRGDYGASGYDQPLNNTSSIVWDLPIFRNSKGLVKTLAGGWQFTDITSLTSGLPGNLNYNVDTNFTVTGLYTYRPNVVGTTKLAGAMRTRTTSGRAINYLNPASVSVPTIPNPFGNAARNSIRSPKFSQTDMGLHKDFQLFREGTQLDFRAEAFNIFNQTNLGIPDTNRSNSTYGLITTAFPGRQLQFAAKLIF